MSGDIDYDGYSAAAAGKSNDQIAAEVSVEVAQALEAAKAVGNMPGALARLAAAYEQASVDWRTVLKRLVIGTYGSACVFGDYSYRRPNRRHSGGDIIMPSIMRQPSEPLVVAIDTSGSIGQAELDQFCAELTAIVRDVRPSRTYVIYCDATVQHVDVFEHREAPELVMHGGGGTAFEPPFAWVAENVPTAKCLVYLTDGYGAFSFSPSDLGLPRLTTIWGMTTDVEAPWGHNVRVKFGRA